MNCIICTDENINLLKICNCVDSNVCISCLNILNENNTTKCPVCRSDLTLIYISNKKKYIFLI